MRSPQDTPLTEPEIGIIEEPMFRIPLVTSRLTLGNQVWSLADINFKYDRFHYVSFWDYVLPAVGVRLCLVLSFFSHIWLNI
jgi:hypothetical protein